jgi:hypothetical protein
VDYYENTTAQPTKSKEITVAVWKPPVFVYPDLMNLNILDKNGPDTVFTEVSYAMRAELPALSKLTLTMKGTGWSIIYPSDWIISPYDDESKSQVFTSPDGSAYCEQTISFSQPGDIELFYKEESNGGINEFNRYLNVLNNQSK